MHSRTRTADGADFGLAPGGVYLAAAITRGAGALLPHRFTLTRRTGQRAVCSLWHCPAGRPGLPLTTTLLCGVRTFLDTGLHGVPHGSGRRGRPADSFALLTLLQTEPRRPHG